MFDSYNEFHAPTVLNLRSALDSEFNLFKIDLEEEDKQKAREYRCSLNELPDPYGPDVLFYPQTVRRPTESIFPVLASMDDGDSRQGLDSTPPTTPDKRDRQQASKGNKKVLAQGNASQQKDQELEDLDLESSFISSLENPELESAFSKKTKSNVTRNTKLFQEMSRNKQKQPLSRKRPNGVKQKPLAVCTCKKSKCLRLYCECFAKGLVCGVDCNCTGCHNTADLTELRELVIQETLEKNPFAFKSKYKRMSKENHTKDDEKLLHSRGCNCSKTGCVKKYCECYNAGTGCSRLCRCSNCKNENIEIDDKDVKFYYDRVLRRRKKRSVLDECFQRKCEIIKKLKIA